MMKKKVFHVSFFKSWKRIMQEVLQTGSTKDLQPDARIARGIRPSLAVGREGILLWMQFRIQPMMVALRSGPRQSVQVGEKESFLWGDERESRRNPVPTVSKFYVSIVIVGVVKEFEMT